MKSFTKKDLEKAAMTNIRSIDEIITGDIDDILKTTKNMSDLEVDALVCSLLTILMKNILDIGLTMYDGDYMEFEIALLKNLRVQFVTATVGKKLKK